MSGLGRDLLGEKGKRAHKIQEQLLLLLHSISQG